MKKTNLINNQNSINNSIEVGISISARFADQKIQEVFYRAAKMNSRFGSSQEFNKKLLKSLYNIIKHNVLDDEEKCELELLIDRIHVELDIPCE